MESLLNSLSLGILLRCFAAGIYGVISYTAATSDAESWDILLKFEPHLLGLALLGGATVYGLHRSLLYPFMEFFLDSERVVEWRKSAPLISEQSCKALQRRWERTGNEHSCKSGIVKHTSNWADWAHMQYSSMWCIIAGAIGAAITLPATLEPSWPLIMIATLFGGSAVVSDWRLHSVEDFLAEGDKPDSSASRKQSEMISPS